MQSLRYDLVPVIVVLTKTDSLVSPAIGRLIDEGLTMKEAKLKAGGLAKEMLKYHQTRITKELDRFNYPPKGCLSLASEHVLCIIDCQLTLFQCRYEPGQCRLQSTSMEYNKCLKWYRAAEASYINPTDQPHTQH